MSNQIDIVAIQQAAEDTVRAEYEVAHKRLAERQKVFERQQAQWGQVVQAVKSNLIDTGEVSEDDLPDVDAIIDHLMVMLAESFKLKKLFKTIGDNVLLQSQWDRLVMSIRLAGGDQND